MKVSRELYQQLAGNEGRSVVEYQNITLHLSKVMSYTPVLYSQKDKQQALRETATKERNLVEGNGTLKIYFVDSYCVNFDAPFSCSAFVETQEALDKALNPYRTHLDKVNGI